MKDFGHTLPGQIFLSIKSKHLQVIVDVRPYHSDMLVNFLNKFAYIQKGRFPHCGLSREAHASQ